MAPSGIGKRVKVCVRLHCVATHFADYILKGVQLYRPFVTESVATFIDEKKRAANTPAEHTHQWTIRVKGVDDEDITYWLKKVQFKLHETYPNPLRSACFQGR
jgi:transcription initiation factor IIF auxiliary subunit